MSVKIYKNLPREAKSIREKVFMAEQGFCCEFDETDNIASHALYFDGERAVAACRFYFNEDRSRYEVGRIAVLKEYRGKSIGSLLLRSVEENIPESEEYIYLHAQIRVKAFYEKQGYESFGEADFDEACPHIWMRKKLHG